jgi:hypothetical protein
VNQTGFKERNEAMTAERVNFMREKKQQEYQNLLKK